MQGVYTEGQVTIITPYGEQLRILQQEAANFMTPILSDRDQEEMGLFTKTEVCIR